MTKYKYSRKRIVKKLSYYMNVKFPYKLIDDLLATTTKSSKEKECKHKFSDMSYGRMRKICLKCSKIFDFNGKYNSIFTEEELTPTPSSKECTCDKDTISGSCPIHSINYAPSTNIKEIKFEEIEEINRKKDIFWSTDGDIYLPLTNNQEKINALIRNQKKIINSLNTIIKK